MVDKATIYKSEFSIAKNKLEMVTRGVGEPKGENNRQAWIHQQDINENLMGLIEELEKRVDWLSREIK